MGTSRLITEKLSSKTASDSGYDVVIVGQQAWDTNIGSNCKNIALELAIDQRVLYVNSPLDRITLYRNKNDQRIQKRANVVRGKEAGLIKIQDNLWNLYPSCMVESINWINNASIFDFLNKRNNRLFANCILTALRQLNFGHFILFNDNEIFKAFYLQEMLDPALSVYYSRDYMLAVDYWKKHGERLEPLLIAKSDICVANSGYLSDYCRQYNPNAYDVGQGCDFELFDDRHVTQPNDIPEFNGPIIGYVGALQEARLDIAIIHHIAESHPDWLVVLVGPESEAFKASALHQFSNIVFTGIKPLHELAGYINAFDVCINPQLINDVTIGNYPRKIDEYLAMGKPTIATSTRAMDIFNDYVYLGATKEDFVTLISKALEEDTGEDQQKRKDFARTHTWKNSVKEMKAAIADHRNINR